MVNKIKSKFVVENIFGEFITSNFYTYGNFIIPIKDNEFINTIGDNFIIEEINNQETYMNYSGTTCRLTAFEIGSCSMTNVASSLQLFRVGS